MPGPKTRLALLGLSGLAMFSCFWVIISLGLEPRLSLFFNVRGARYGGPLTWPSRLFHLASLSSGTHSVLYVVLMLALTAGYLSAIYMVRDESRRTFTLVIAGGFTAFILLFLFAPPFQSRDIYSYAFQGRAMTVYHANPYLLIPAARPSDVFYPLIGWKDNASVYGPIFNYLSYGIARLTGDNIAANVLGFKALAVASFAGSLPFIYTLTRRISPGRENLALAVAAWCPILIMHVAGAGHNEPVMALFVLAGFYALWRGRGLLGLILVVLAATVKANAALALAPYVWFYLFRDKRGSFWPRLAASAVAVVVIPFLLYLPFLHGTAILKSMGQMFKLYSYSSVPMLTKTFLYNVFRGIGVSSGTAASIAGSLTHAFFLLLLTAVAVALLFRTKDFRTMVLAAAGIALIWVLTADYILPWYLTLGIIVTGIAGWNATTGCLVAAASVFTFYRIPHFEHHALTHVALGSTQGPTSYVSVPLAIILIAWLFMARPFRGPKAEPAVEGSASSSEVVDGH